MVSKFFSLTTLLLFYYLSFSQGCYTDNSGVLDGTTPRSTITTKKVIPYPYVAERDVLWKKRIWRSIDIREKINHPLFYPEEPISDRASLFDIIKCAVLQEKSLTIYELGIEFDDQFKYPVVPVNGNPNNEEYNKRLLGFFGESQSIPRLDDNDEFVYDESGFQIFDDTILQYTSLDIIRYDIKEEWFFDSKYSRMNVRILGISPVVYYRNQETGDIMGTKNLFWLYFPQCRYVFQNYKVYNRFNDSMEMSFDDLFWKRQFSSYITKESNIYGRNINQYARGREALLESERVKEDLFITEHDMWHY